jgi:hypothetical protein
MNVFIGRFPHRYVVVENYRFASINKRFMRRAGEATFFLQLISVACWTPPSTNPHPPRQIGAVSAAASKTSTFDTRHRTAFASTGLGHDLGIVRTTV